MAAEQKAVNLAGEPRVVLTTGSNRWNQGLDDVGEGDAARAATTKLRALADL